MVLKTRIQSKIETSTLFGGPSKKVGIARKELAPAVKRETGVVPPNLSAIQVHLPEAEESVDVIDLGAPRGLRSAATAPARPPGAPPSARARVAYTPNPRLYPGPPPKKKRAGARAEGRAGANARRRVFRRPVPNSRLYRPAPRRAPPPPRAPRGPWPPPAPAARLDTASRAALRLAAHPAPPAPPAAPAAPAAAPARRLVVTLPAGMDAAARHSTSPDDCSDGADALSAPSEFLAEFLSTIMRRQYAEALKYCRLILQYEPHNATARGFFPLLQHKVQALKRNEGAGGSSSGSSSSPAQRSRPSRSLSHSRSRPDSRSTHEASTGREKCRSRDAGGRSRSGSGSGSESGGSVASQSSLELDSSSASAGASASRSGSASPSARSDTRSATRSRSDPDSSDARDDNGNLPGPAHPPRSGTADDVENDNDVSHIKSESSASLRRLRAQFACSIK